MGHSRTPTQNTAGDGSPAGGWGDISEHVDDLLAGGLGE
jgi:hypothetical protein